MSDDEVKRRISANMPRLRGQVSLSETARRVGTYPTTIKEIEEGKRVPGVGMLTRIAAAFNCTLDDFLRPVKNSRKSA